MLCAREYASAMKKGGAEPEMIAPETIHVAWEKAARYFKFKMVRIPVKDDFTMDVDQLKKKISRRTILIVASAPSYPHGVIDPIERIAQAAAEKNILFHVDACLCGFFLPFMEKTGFRIRPFDFRCEGVTSISADVHKYGFGAKGASVLLYRHMDYLKHQFFYSYRLARRGFCLPCATGHPARRPHCRSLGSHERPGNGRILPDDRFGHANHKKTHHRD